MILACILGIAALVLILACPVMFMAVLDSRYNMPIAIGVAFSIFLVAVLMAYGADVAMKNYYAGSQAVEAIK